MSLFFLLSRALATLGRWSAPAVAASVFIGLALPPLAAVAKPLIVATILALLTLAFLRTDLSGTFSARRTGVALLAVAWSMLALPLALGAVTSAMGEPSGVTLALLMQACAPPIMSAPAFALLLGLDPRLVLAVMVGAMVLTPLSAPLLVAHFSHGALQLDALGLAVRLGAVLGGTAAAGLALRAFATPGRVALWRAHLDGLNVLLLALLAVGLMDGVTAWFIADPGFVAGLLAVAFALSLGALGVTALLFRRIGAGDALMVGFAAGHRNISVMVAATGAVLPPETWLYVAVAQFPIYLLPLFLMPLARRIRAVDPEA
ncbi:hypothetical protein EZH22_19195 [Xanthobacter dioxanivorans]|uniref:Na+-dependent transporter n=1 Tax=Xanthobacter dioxanivorans TaxID=2528964 RepID=A0A974PL72_9HYPH|nr:Na+-dependent transporter [Xanthobacter dioxanivorans]QRG05224.1 hypothetical protein EZH22_19195 [Xanthobacter dioxanivorans]